MGVDIINNAKTSRPSVCNAAETLLVHEAIAKEFLPKMAQTLSEVELRGCEKTRAIIKAKAVSEEDYYTEFNDYILAVKVVGDIERSDRSYKQIQHQPFRSYRHKGLRQRREVLRAC